jgi:hypothetical protein
VYQIQNILFHLPQSIRGVESFIDAEDAKPAEEGTRASTTTACRCRFSTTRSSWSCEPHAGRHFERHAISWTICRGSEKEKAEEKEVIVWAI